MSDSLPLIFRVFQIVIPTFAVIIFCTALCKCVLQSRKRRHEQRRVAEASAQAREAPSSIYIIPFSPSEEQDHRPPCYSQTLHYTPPPPYYELMAKPDFPCDSPPAYSESTSPPFISSYPGQIPPPCPTLPE